MEEALPFFFIAWVVEAYRTKTLPVDPSGQASGGGILSWLFYSILIYSTCVVRCQTLSD